MRQGRGVIRRFALCLIALALSACAGANDLDGPPVYLGNFKLGHNIVVSPDPVQGPASREASGEEWIEAVTKSVDARFSRYETGKFVNLGISVDGYVLAPTGIPIIAAPRSFVLISVTAWNDAEARKFNEDPKSITVVEDLSAETTVSSGLTQSKEQQIENLSVIAAKLIEKWLVEQNNELGWFEDDGRPAKDKDTPRFQPQPVVVEDVEEPAEEVSDEVPEEPTEDPAPAT